MPESLPETIMAALATQIETGIGGTADPAIERLQVVGLLVFNPTPPAIDIYPADPFQEDLGFGRGNKSLNFIVRARVSTAEHEGGQKLLLSMMDPDSDTSLEGAIASDPTLSNEVESATVESGPSEYGLFGSPGNELLGCTWRVRVFP